LTNAQIEEQLAYQIPALTFAAGHEGVGVFEASGKNINIQKKYLSDITAQWPKRTNIDYEWRHNDLYYVAYPYLFRLFDDFNKIVKNGGL